MKRSDLKKLILECKEELFEENKKEPSDRTITYVRQAKAKVEMIDDLIYKVTTSKLNLDEDDLKYFKDMLKELLKPINEFVSEK